MRAEDLFEAEAERRGWSTLRAGWPDRLVFDEEGRARFIEVKMFDDLSSGQRKMFAALEGIGVHVEIWLADTKELIPWREFKQHRPSQRGKQKVVPYKSRAEWKRSRAHFDPVLGC